MVMSHKLISIYMGVERQPGIGRLLAVLVGLEMVVGQVDPVGMLLELVGIHIVVH